MESEWRNTTEGPGVSGEINQILSTHTRTHTQPAIGYFAS